MIMKPDSKFITINTSANQLANFINEVMLTPRLKAIEWSKITKQTPGLKIGYPAQHIASLLTGVEGRRSAARGDDLADGSEVKGCNRIDQLDTCKSCGNKVLRYELKCNFCNSTEIIRKDDSKWLLTIKSESELNLYINKIDRLIFILLDYPKFAENNFETLSVKAYEIWPKANPTFKQILKDYYYNIYLEHIKLDPKKTPAPKNFWPYSFQFYKCKPLKTYECLITDINSNPQINTLTYVSPTDDRALLIPEDMPTEILNNEELSFVIEHHRDVIYKEHPAIIKHWDNLTSKQKTTKAGKELIYKILPTLPHFYLDCIELRDTSKATPHATEYSRR
jgi:hypothetical protein